MVQVCSVRVGGFWARQLQKFQGTLVELLAGPCHPRGGGAGPGQVGRQHWSRCLGWWQAGCVWMAGRAVSLLSNFSFVGITLYSHPYGGALLNEDKM